MKTIDLQTMELSPLLESEMQATIGGGFMKFIKGGIFGLVINTVIENWDDLKKGFSDGWNSIN